MFQPEITMAVTEKETGSRPISFLEVLSGYQDMSFIHLWMIP